MTKFSLVLLILIFSKSFAIKKDTLLPLFEDLKKRTLLVCLETENAKFVEKQQRKNNLDELGIYQNGIKLTNENLKKAIKACWSLNTKIKYIPTDSLEWYVNKNSIEYAYIKMGESRVHASGYISVNEERGEYVAQFYNAGLFLYLCDRKAPIATCNFPSNEIGQSLPSEQTKNNVLFSDYYVSVSKLMFALHRFTWSYSDLVKNPNRSYTDAISSGINDFERIGELKTLTLIAREQDCEKKFDLEKAKKYYPYAIKIVSDEDFEKAMLSKDPNVACVFVTLVSSHSMGNGGVTRTTKIFIQNALNAKDGSLLTGFAGSFGLNYKVIKYFNKQIIKQDKKNE